MYEKSLKFELSQSLIEDLEAHSVYPPLIHVSSLRTFLSKHITRQTFLVRISRRCVGPNDVNERTNRDVCESNSYINQIKEKTFFRKI